jgi:nucleoside transporter
MGSVKARLSLMMFLEFFIWGAWLPLIFGYLPAIGFTDGQQFWVTSAFAFGALTAMFFSTQFADRKFAAEKFLAFSHLVGGISMLALFWVRDFHPFLRCMLIHSLFYVPTISITNGIAFASLKDAQKDFGRVRLWGTIGWIAASVPFVFVLADWEHVPALADVGFVEWLGAALGTSKQGEALIAATRYTFVAAGVASLLLALVALGLPHTPPKPASGSDRFAWLEATRLLKHPFVLVLFIVTFFDAAVHNGYFWFANEYLQSVGIPANWVMPVMSIGQVAEIATMAVLGGVLSKLGWRTTMTIGILGHAMRFGTFALLPTPAPAIVVNALHGICYAFFFATVYIFVDEYFPKDVRSSAQGLFNLLILGVGPLTANYVCPRLKSMYSEAGVVDYSKVMLVPAGVALAAAVFLFLFFRPPQKAGTPARAAP